MLILTQWDRKKKKSLRNFLILVCCQPVPNSKCISVMGNYSPLLNHRLIHITFLTCQSCVQFDSTLVRLGKDKFPYGDRTEDLSLPRRFSPHCATVTVEILSFEQLKYALRRQFRSKQIILHGRLALQLPSTDLHLEFGPGKFYKQVPETYVILIIFCMHFSKSNKLLEKNHSLELQ